MDGSQKNRLNMYLHSDHHRLATKKRKRGLVGIRLVRGDTLFAVVAAYHESIRPTTILLKATILNEAVPIKMFVGLNSIQNLLRVQSSSLKWSSDEIRAFTGRALRFVKLVAAGPGAKSLKLNDLTGTDGRLVKVKSLAKNIESAARRKPNSIVSDANIVWNELDRDYADESSNEAVCAVTGVEETATQTSLSALQMGYNWCSLGMYGRARQAGRALGVHSKPLRDIGRGIRLTSRATSVGGIYCIYTLYARCMVGPVGSVPVWPPVEEDDPIELLKKDVSDTIVADDDDDDADDGSNLNERYETESGGYAASDDDDEALHQVNAVKVDMKNESFDAIANDTHFDLFVYIPYGGMLVERVVEACSHYVLPFARDAFDTLVSASHRELIGTALRSLYRRFYFEASAVEVSEAEKAWDLVGREIMLRCR